MHYLPVEKSLQEVFAHTMPLSSAQSGRIAALCNAILLAGAVHLTKIARFLKGDTQQDSRVRWIQRLLEAAFVSQERVYQPVLKQALKAFHEPCWHVVIDRTALWDGKVDLATISLNYRKRAIPLVWTQVPYGGAPEATYIQLLKRCVPLIPTGVQVVFHGDTEFGGAGMIRVLREIGWDFILAQPSHCCFRPAVNAASVPLVSLPVTPHHSCQVAQVELFAQQRLGGINILAFYQPHYSQPHKRKRAVCYLATSLPLTPSLRRLGRRRWGTEPFYRDYKSAGWQVTASQLGTHQRQEGLLILLALSYLWSVCIGRWLCKTGRRRQVDNQPTRHLSLFRIGWDWLIHQLRCDLPSPPLLRLYT
jgi:Transposase DDE domain